jgi:geranylgeranyl pyrophosphate synthase
MIDMRSQHSAQHPAQHTEETPHAQSPDAFESSLEMMHAKKTGALLIASARMGALCAHATDAQLEAATEYAQAIGLMFQIVDDLLDVEQTPDAIGKATGKDAAMGKRTFPGVIGIDQSRTRVASLLQTAESAAHRLPSLQEELTDFASMLATRTR